MNAHDKAPAPTFVFALAAGIISLAAACFAVSQRSFVNHHALLEGPPGSVSWKLLADAKGFGFTNDLQYIPRTYPRAVEKLADNEISIKGYMVTIQPMGKFSSFLLVPFPPTCPYCIPAGPNQIIETHTSEPVAYSLQPVVMQGILRLHKDDISSMFYFMEDAHIIDN